MSISQCLRHRFDMLEIIKFLLRMLRFLIRKKLEVLQILLKHKNFELPFTMHFSSICYRDQLCYKVASQDSIKFIKSL